VEHEYTEKLALALDSIKECYEAYVIYCFLELLFICVGVDRRTGSSGDLEYIVPEKIKGHHLHHSGGFQYFLREIHADAAGLKALHYYTLQFVILRPICSLIELCSEIFDFEWLVHWPLTIVLNISVTLAVYALILFYHAFDKDPDFKQYTPLAKFLAIKGVVFFAFWQGLIIELLVLIGLIHEGHFWKVDELEDAISNYLVTLEMALIFSYAFRYAFSTGIYKLVKDRDAKKSQ